MDDEHIGETGTDDEGLSLEDIGAAYARAAAQHDPEAFSAAGLGDDDVDSDGIDDEADGNVVEPLDDAEHSELVTPEAIVEAALFVGHPDNKLLTEQRLASLMREVTPEEVIELIESLNRSYREFGQAIRIVGTDEGYRMTVAPDTESVRKSFLGKVREARLSQGAIEVLSLVAYQPGISAQMVQDQRGRPDCGTLLNQLVRRQLLSLERKVPAEGGRAIAHYHPTERFLALFELESLEDLPQVEESLRGVT